MTIETTPDHVAIAVPSIEAAAHRWRSELGGGWVMPRFAADEAGFATRQLTFRGGGRLELLEPLAPDTFAGRFVARYGASVHHLTLKVPDLLPAVEAVRSAGYDVVDVSTEGDVWHEGFLRPSQVGGMIVQLAWAGRDDAEWAELTGVAPEAPAPGAAVLHGPTLLHPDPATAAALWLTLGAEVATRNGGLDVTWPDAPLSVRVDPGDRATAAGLRFAGTALLPADPAAGPPILPQVT